MIALFYQGGAIFMGILTIILLIIIIIFGYKAVQITNKKVEHLTTFRHSLQYIKSIGLFALILGLLGQLAGLYQMFSYIERAGAVSPEVLMGGLRVTMLPTLYGIIIFLISYAGWFALDYKLTAISN